MDNSEPARYAYTDGLWQVLLPIAPVPASRPRVGRYGTYYPKTYKAWMVEAAALLADVAVRPVRTPIGHTPFFVQVASVCRHPQRLVREMPRGDVDNYAKAALDAITKAALIWVDDDQVQVLLASKRYADVDEQPHTYIRAAQSAELAVSPDACWVTPVVGEDVYDLPADQRVSLSELENTNGDET